MLSALKKKKDPPKWVKLAHKDKLSNTINGGKKHTQHSAAKTATIS